MPGDVVMQNGPGAFTQAARVGATRRDGDAVLIMLAEDKGTWSVPRSMVLVLLDPAEWVV